MPFDDVFTGRLLLHGQRIVLFNRTTSLYTPLDFSLWRIHKETGRGSVFAYDDAVAFGEVGGVFSFYFFRVDFGGSVAEWLPEGEVRGDKWCNCKAAGADPQHFEEGATGHFRVLDTFGYTFLLFPVYSLHYFLPLLLRVC